VSERRRRSPGTRRQDRPVHDGQPRRVEAIPAQIVREPPTFAYLRQTTRTNNAAPVADGATKPTSVYGLTRAEDRLRVIAHLSEPINKYHLEDAADLRVFVDNELGYGLDLAVEQQLLSGDGTGENLRGILNTSGIQAQT
jgi:HK97 family phage major capsid protein